MNQNHSLEPLAPRNRAAERRHPSDPDLLTVPQAAAKLGLHPDSAYRLARAGKLPGAIQVGSRWYVSVPRLERHLHGEAS